MILYHTSTEWWLSILNMKFRIIKILFAAFVAVAAVSVQAATETAAKMGVKVFYPGGAHLFGLKVRTSRFRARNEGFRVPFWDKLLSVAQSINNSTVHLKPSLSPNTQAKNLLFAVESKK